MPNNPNLASALTLGYVFIIVVVPLIGFSLAVMNEAGVILAGINSGQTSIQDQVQNLQNQIPMNNKALSNFGITAEQIKTRILEFRTNTIHGLAGYVVDFTKGIFRFLFHFFLVFYVLFFFLRDGRKLINVLFEVIPINDDIERELLGRFQSVRAGNSEWKSDRGCFEWCFGRSAFLDIWFACSFYVGRHHDCSCSFTSWQYVGYGALVHYCNHAGKCLTRFCLITDRISANRGN